MNALYKFAFDIHIDTEIVHLSVFHLNRLGSNVKCFIYIKR